MHQKKKQKEGNAPEGEKKEGKAPEWITEKSRKRERKIRKQTRRRNKKWQGKIKSHSKSEKKMGRIRSKEEDGKGIAVHLGQREGDIESRPNHHVGGGDQEVGDGHVPAVLFLIPAQASLTQSIDHRCECLK